MSEIKTPEEFWKDTQFEKQYETSFGFAKRYTEYYHRQALTEVLEEVEGEFLTTIGTSDNWGEISELWDRVKPIIQSKLNDE